MKVYTVSKLAKLASVSVRTLHHYDETGLLKPSFRSDSGYRQYQREDLLRLQQILFFRKRIEKLSKKQWKEVKEEGGAIALEMAKLMDHSPGSDEVQILVRRHHAWIKNFWTPNAESYKGLGRGYVENPEFREYYDKFRPGLADFLCKAMEYYAEKKLG